MNGVTLTASNFSNGGSRANANGLCFAGSRLAAECGRLIGLNLSFSAPVQLISFISSGNYQPTLSFSDGVNSSLQSYFTNGSTTNFANQFSVAANQSITVLETVNPSPTLSRSLRFTQLTVDATPVPLETDTLPVVGSAVFMAGGLWWKRKRAQAKGADFIAQK